MQKMKDLAGPLQGCFHSAMATLAQIATEAGVSEATVSRVLNSKPGVSEGTRQSVITALDVLGYERPTHLRQRSAGLVGLVVPELENPIFPAFAQVIEDALARRRFTPVLCTQSPGSLSEDEYVESLLDHGVAGIIFVSGKHADTRADHDRYRVADRAGTAGRLHQRLRRRRGRAVRLRRRPRGDGHRGGAPGPPRPPPHRPRDRSRALHAVGAQARGLRRRPRTPPRHAAEARRAAGSPRRSSPSRAAPRPPASCSSRAPRPSSAART